MELKGLGLDTTQIANEMNRLGLESPRGRPYTGKLVWVTVKKWKDREVRMNDSEITINSVEPILTFLTREPVKSGQSRLFEQLIEGE